MPGGAQRDEQKERKPYAGKEPFFELPEGDELASSVDAVKNKKFAALMNVAAGI